MDWSDSYFPDWGDTDWQVLNVNKNHAANNDLQVQVPVHVKEEAESEIDYEQQQQQQQQQLEAPEPVFSTTNAIAAFDPVIGQEQQLQQQQQQQQQQQEAPANVSDVPIAAATKSGVDGVGMWKSWTHNYEHPRFACLDLIDNCFDATLHPNFEGKIWIKQFGNNGMTIINNSFKTIKPLEETLTAYRSEKNSAEDAQLQQACQQRKDAIGEYGVGLKQACATLSDTSFVLTRNKNILEFGIVAESLQTKNSVFFPKFSFTIEGNTDTDTNSSDRNWQNMTEWELELELTERITNAVSTNESVLLLVVRELGNGKHKEGIQALVQRFMLMCTDKDWKDYANVFQLILTDLIHTQSRQNNPYFTSANHQKFMNEIRELLPKYYINIPLIGFSFYLNNERVLFSYWQHRLVEMTKFTVYIPKDKPIADIRAANWFQQGYELSVYCGFDALRIIDGQQPKTCQLNIYSRASGRLITVEDDARALLGLASSGVDYSQGLTVIVDDVGGELPLKPTKDGITWSKDAKGEAHKSNLLAWTGAVAFQYWKHHANLFAKKCKSTESKTLLSRAVKSFAEPVKARLAEQERMAKEKVTLDDDDEDLDPSWKYERLEKAKFTMFSDVTWKKKISKNDMKLKIQRSGRQVVTWPGPATVHKFDDHHYNTTAAAPPQEKVPAAKVLPNNKRARTNSGRYARGSEKDHDGDDSSSGSEEEEEVQLWNFSRPSSQTSAPSASAMLRRHSSGSNRSSTTKNKRGLSDGQHTAATDPNQSPSYASKIQRLEQQVQSLQLSLQTCKRDSRVAQDQVSRLQESLHSAFEQIIGLETQVQNAEDRRISDVSALQRENVHLKLQLQQKDRTIEHLQQEQQQRFFGNWGGWGGLDSV